MNCPQCGNQNEPGVAFCDNCGASLTSAAAPPAGGGIQPTMAVGGTCPQCGQQVIAGEAFCDNCGAALPATHAGGQPPPSQSAAPSYPPPSSQQQPAAPSYSSPPPTGGSMTCPSCGTQVPPGAAFCDNCGSALAGSPPPPQPSPPPPQPGPPAGGATCPNCGTPATPGAAFCDNCGASLSTPEQPQHSSQPDPQPWQQSSPGPSPGPAQPPVQAGPSPRLVVQSSSASLPFPAGKVEIIAGREDPVSNVFPEIDLDPHGGDEGGVSRRHAKFTLQGNQWYIQDLNSTNFSFVNKQKLQPNQLHPVNHGDEVRLGRVVLTFFTS